MDNLTDKLEPEVAHHGAAELNSEGGIHIPAASAIAHLSAAVSLKRIADALDQIVINTKPVAAVPPGKAK